MRLRITKHILPTSENHRELIFRAAEQQKLCVGVLLLQLGCRIRHPAALPGLFLPTAEAVYLPLLRHSKFTRYHAQRSHT